MTFGTLHVTLPGGVRRDYPLEQQGFTVGQSEENEITIEEASLSQRHARFIVAPAQVLVEDLDSSGGTFVDGERIPPRTPVRLREGQTVRMGAVEATYSPPQIPTSESRPDDRPTQAGPALAGDSTVLARVIGPSEAIIPGGEAQATLRLRNIGDVVDEYLLRVSGIPSDWIELSRQRLPLLPGQEETVILKFRIPRSAQSTAGRHPYQITVYSREFGKAAVTRADIRIHPFREFEMEVEPAVGEQEFELLLENCGNTPGAYRLEGNDAEAELSFEFDQTEFSLPAGGEGSIRFRVRPVRRPIFGRPQPQPFRVNAIPIKDGGEPVSAHGQTWIRPVLPIWIVPLVLVVALCGCFSLVYAYSQFCEDATSDSLFCPPPSPPSINTFQASPEMLTGPGEIVTIRWDIDRADRIELFSPELGLQTLVGPNGEQNFTLNQTTSFGIVATNEAGSSDRTLAVVVPGTPPLVQTFTADPGTVIQGYTGIITIFWDVVAADTVTIEGLTADPLPQTGSMEIPAPATPITYVLNATNSAGTVSEQLQVNVIPGSCVIHNVPVGQSLQMLSGPGIFYPPIVELNNGANVSTLGRTEAGDWMRIAVAGQEGWVQPYYLACSVSLTAYPTVSPGAIPPPPPTPTGTLPPSPTPPPTTPPPTPTDTDTPAPATETPVPATATLEPTATGVPASPTPVGALPGEGAVTYRLESGGQVAIFLQGPQGNPIPLVSGVDNASVLDYTSAGGGLYAIWALQSGQNNLYIVRSDGQALASGINHGWGSIADADWSPDGQRLVVEGVDGNTSRYYFLDTAGNLLGQPTF